jgi:hypothetical protein
VSRRIAAAGLSVTPPSGWEATIYRRPALVEHEVTLPIMHAATVPLPTERGDYGGGLVEMLGPEDVFVSVLEFGTDAATTPLFSQITGVPGLTPDLYRPRQLQRTIRGQAGVQRFFNASGRAFVLYSVIGAFANRSQLAGRANQLIGTFHVE